MAARATPTEERYALAMESINYGLYDWDLETDAVYFAPSLRILLGLTSAALSKPLRTGASGCIRATGRSTVAG